MTNDSKLNNITDIELSEVRRKRFRIDGDDTRILELNTSDLNLLIRLKEAYPKLTELANGIFTKLPDIQAADDFDFTTDEATTKTIDILKKADSDMRELVDYIFDSNVSDICVPNGSMYDPLNGKFRFEHIIESLAGLYESEISKEMKKVSTRIKKHTDKYAKKVK